MRNVRILPYKRGSNSAAALASELGALRISLTQSRIHNQAPKRIINWGNSGRNLPPQGIGDQHTFINTPEAVAIAANKLSAFEAMQVGGVRVPDFTTDYEEALDWLEHGKVVERHNLFGHSGQGIEIVEDSDCLCSDVPLYVKYIPKQDEYRIHIMAGEVIDMQRKARNRDVADEDVNWQVRNHSNGFIFMREGVNPPADVIAQAKAAILSTGLDFGAVDVIWNQHREKAYVLEINTACGLEGTTLERYTDAFREYLERGSVTALDAALEEADIAARDAFMATSPTASRMSDVRREQARYAIERAEFDYEETARALYEQLVPTQSRQWAVGDEVMISPTSQYYGRSGRNPSDVRGVVRNVREWGMPLEVRWDNRTCNVYNHEDLIAWQGSVSRPLTLSQLRTGMQLRSLRNVIYGASVVESEIVTVSRVNSDRFIAGGWIFRESDLEYFELISDPDVQSSTGSVESVTQEWVVTVDGNINSDDETFSSREEAEMALVSPEFHNLRAMGRHVAVQQL